MLCKIGDTRDQNQKDIPTWRTIKLAPCVCRILARLKDPKTGKVRLMSNRELMERTGWGKKKLQSIYERAEWHDVTHRDTDLFLWACGIHPSLQRKQAYLVARVCKNGGIRKLRHLRWVPVGWQEYQVRMLLKMCERVLNEFNASG